jgi:hypothetical protein
MTYDLESLGELLRALPPAPSAWVQAAQELPPRRGALDDIVARAERDVEFRRRLVADLESALAAEGYDAEPRVLDALRRRLAPE